MCLQHVVSNTECLHRRRCRRRIVAANSEQEEVERADSSTARDETSTTFADAGVTELFTLNLNNYNDN